MGHGNKIILDLSKITPMFLMDLLSNLYENLKDKDFPSFILNVFGSNGSRKFEDNLDFPQFLAQKLKIEDQCEIP